MLKIIINFIVLLPNIDTVHVIFGTSEFGMQNSKIKNQGCMRDALCSTFTIIVNMRTEDTKLNSL